MFPVIRSHKFNSWRTPVPLIGFDYYTARFASSAASGSL